MKIDLSKAAGVSLSANRMTVADYCNSLELDEAASVDEIASELGVSRDHVRAQIRESGLRIYINNERGLPSPHGASAATIAKYKKP